MRMSMGNQNWRLGRGILVMLVLLLATKESNGQRTIRQLTDSIRLSKYKGSVLFAQPGMPCDEEEALRVGNFLYFTTRNFDLAKEEDLKNLAKDICDYKEDPGSLMVEDIICLNFKCQCLHPTKEWNPDSGKCRNRYGESCVDEDDCAYNQICSDMKGPPKIVRLSEYRWQTKRKCKEDCIRTTCEAKNRARCLHPGFKASLCKVVTDCLQDPFQVIFHCIAKCHKCEGSANAVALELCQHECGKEVSNYATAAINRVCHLTCRSEHDPKGCVKTCEKENFHLLKARIVGACPFSVLHEKCVACVSDKIRFNATAIAGLTDDCTQKCGKDVDQCKTNCKTYCIAQKDHEIFFQCQIGCKDESKLNPLCARNRHNIALSKTKDIETECNDECAKAPSVCDLCIDNCREYKILEYQQGTVDSSIKPNCNDTCAPVSLYSCTACQGYMYGFQSHCEYTCNSATANNCSSVCTSTCNDLQQQVGQSKCYKKCLQSPEPLCFFDCIKTSQQMDGKLCDKKCSSTKTWNGKCTECLEVCPDIDKDLRQVYCDNSSKPLVCKVQSACDEYEEITLQKCLVECKIELNQDDSVRCHERCLDVCDSTRRFFYELAGNKNANRRPLSSCEQYCETGSRIGCTAGCESYCEATKSYRCDCTPDRKEAKFITLPILDLKDKCISCRRRFRLRGRTECRKRLCAAPVGADESGGICLQQCIIQAYRQLIIETQSRAIEFCNFSGDRVCEDDRIKETVEQRKGQIIRILSFQRCLNTGLNRGFINLCLDKECDRLCERAVEYEADLACGIKDGDCVEMESSRKDQVILPPEPCRNCSIRVAVEYLAACRKQCSLPPDLIGNPLIKSQIERRSLICITTCLQVCFTQKFHSIYHGCLKEYVPGGLALTEYLKQCTSKYKHYIVNECFKSEDCGIDDFSNGLIHDCPKCADACHLDSYFIVVAVGIMCKDCTKPDFKPPDICEMCKHTLIKEKKCEYCLAANCEKSCPYYCARLSCLKRVNRYNRFNEEETTACIKKILETDKKKVAGKEIATLVTAEGMACEAKCKANCESTCYGYCMECYRLQGYCDMDCNPRLVGVKTEVNNIQPMFRQSRKDPRGPVRPTRRPGPGKFEQQWCCFSNGLGQCNAPRPGKESQHESQAVRTIDSTQSIWKYFIIIQLLSLAMIL